MSGTNEVSTMGEAQNMAEYDVEEPDGAEPTTAAEELNSTPLGGEVMELLAEHVPLALLADLAAPSDRISAEILKSEGLPDDAWWEATDDAAAASTDAVAQSSEPEDGHSLTT